MILRCVKKSSFLQMSLCNSYSCRLSKIYSCNDNYFCKPEKKYSPARQAGEVLMCFLCKIAILKCFFFNLLLRFFVGALGDWRQAICRHYFSASAFLDGLIQFMIFRTASFSVMCFSYLHFLAGFCWLASSSKLN